MYVFIYFYVLIYVVASTGLHLWSRRNI